MRAIYDKRFFDNDGGLGSFWGDVVGQVGAAGVSLLPGLFGGGGSSSGQAKGLQAITAFGQQAMQTLQQILQGVTSGQLSPADGVANAQRIVAALSDPKYVYQAQRGDDANALASFKQQAGQMLSQIQALAAAVPTGTTTTPAATTTPTGTATTTTPATSSGIGTGTLLLVGGGLLGLVLLMRK